MWERRLRHTVFIDFVEVEDAGDFYVSAETKAREYLKQVCVEVLTFVSPNPVSSSQHPALRA